MLVTQPTGNQLIDFAKAQADEWRQRCGEGAALPPADLIPGYTLLGEVHRGGQGIVYKARNDSTQRLVAIKVLRWHDVADSNEVNRFEREVRILAAIHHPNIVSLHGGGAIGDYRYFVMDYVDGVPFDEYACAHHLSICDTLKLIERVCLAIQSAHVRGIVHRDLKPRNVLIDANGEPQILDFGLGKTLQDADGHLPNQPGNTQTGRFVGSIPWAAPEQVTGNARLVDIRTDVYALGLMLYHALTQRFPFDTDDAPHVVLSSIASNETVSPSVYSPSIARDLETIILKCLSKEPSRRYQSARELAMDLERYRNGFAIDARRDSTWYVVTKAVNRHRAVAALALILAVSAIAYSVSITMLYDRATTAEQSAQQHADDAKDKLDKATDALGFMVREVSDLLRKAPGASEARREILEGAYERLIALVDKPIENTSINSELAQAHMQLGDIAMELGNLGDAELHFLEALSLRQALRMDEPDRPEFRVAVSISTVRVGDAAKQHGDLEKARELYGDALVIDEALASDHPDNVDLLDNLLWSYERTGNLDRKLGQLEAANSFLQKQLVLAQRLYTLQPNEPARLFAVFSAKGQLYNLVRQSGNELALRQYATDLVSLADDLHCKQPGEPYYKYRAAVSQVAVATYYREHGDFEQAKGLATLALREGEKLVVAEPEYVAYRSLLANACLELARIAEHAHSPDWNESLVQHRLAEEHAHRYLEYSPDDPNALILFVRASHGRAIAASALERHTEAAKAFRDALGCARTAVETPRETVNLLCQLASMLRDPVTADARDLDESLKVAYRAMSLDRRESAGPMHEVGRTLAALGRNEEAEAMLQGALQRAAEGDLHQRHQIETELAELRRTPMAVTDAID